MRFNWDDFKAKYQNEQEARQGFNNLCEILMQKKYPEFTIKNSDTIEAKGNQIDETLSKKCKVYLAKYFLDGVSNSRKGQIRKSLNDNLPYMMANKITEWYLLLPLDFSQEESNWWENWSLRIKQENGVTPIVFLTDKLEEMIADLDQDFPGTESIPRRKMASGFEIVQEAVQASSNMLDFVTDNIAPAADTQASEAPVIDIIDAPTIETDAAITEPDAPATEPDATTAASETENTDAGVITSVVEDGVDKTIAVIASMQAASPSLETADENNDDSSDDDSKTPRKKSTVAEPTLNQLALSWKFKQKFEALEAEKLALPTDKDNNQRKVFDDRRDASNVKNYLNDFVFGDMSKFKGKELIKKAKIYVTNKQFSRGLYIYEYANAKQLLEEDKLQEEYNKGVDEANYNLNYKYHMINGDLLFAKRDYINASESYKKALDTLEDWEEQLKATTNVENNVLSSLVRDKEAEIKHLEATAESLLQVGEFEAAIKNFNNAIELDPYNENLKKRLKLAEYLNNSNYFKHPMLSWLNIFIAPFLYFRARKIDPNIRELDKAEKLRNRAIWGLVIMVLILAAIVWLFFWTNRTIKEFVEDVDSRDGVVAASTPVAIHQSRGDYYMSRISADKPHYIDSAINAYERALRYDNTDTAAEIGYRKAMMEKNSYLEMVQKNISTDSATYFLSMRRPTEGLRLFKYKYDPLDPEKGKFGYVDTLGNVKIAPVFDFNYKKMDSQGETFYNGRALVCLKVAEGDTIYFYIDQRGNRIEE